MAVSDQATPTEEAYADLDAVLARIAALDYTTLSVPELLDLLSRRERSSCAAESVDHVILCALQAQTTPKEIGAKNWAEVLRIRQRISGTEASRRVRDAANLGPRTSLTGEQLPPLWPEVAAAQAAGAINVEHVAAITNFFTKLPDWVNLETRTETERDLVAAARNENPDKLRGTARDKLYLLDQDGPEPDDREPEPDKDRAFVLSKQQADGSFEVKARLTALGGATWAALMVKYAARGMCNPADPEPCVSGTSSQAQIDNDHRTPAQRRHDAFEYLGRLLLSSDLGEHNGFPVTIVATCTLEQLEQRAGVALTHTGSHLPVKDLLNMAAQPGADHYLTVFDNHREVPLYLGRARRTASRGQRLALFSREGGCSHPDCDQPAAHAQVHHAVRDWQHGGQTNIDELTLACGPHNRLVTDGGWSTTMKNGRVHWTPPPLLDVGQPRTNRHNRLYPIESESGDETHRAAS